MRRIANFPVASPRGSTKICKLFIYVADLPLNRLFRNLSFHILHTHAPIFPPSIPNAQIDPALLPRYYWMHKLISRFFFFVAKFRLLLSLKESFSIDKFHTASSPFLFEPSFDSLDAAVRRRSLSLKSPWRDPS